MAGGRYLYQSMLAAGLICGLAAAYVSDRVLLADGSDAESPLLKGHDALGDATTDAPGVRRLITVDDLPKPFDTPSVDNGPHLVKRPVGVTPKAPAGFEVDLLAEHLENPRKIVTAPNGDLFIAESGKGRVKILHPGADGKIESTNIFADDLHQPFGIAFYPAGPDPKYVYVGNTDAVVRFAYHNGDLKAQSAAEVIVPDIPGGGKLRGGGHWTRDVVFSQDGKKMLVSVGSHSNVDDNPQAENHRADILEYNPDGTGFRIYAAGIRNPVGLAVDPHTGTLWASVNERDGLGDFLPPDYITQVQDGGFYGWPWYYIGNHEDPRHKGNPQYAGKVIVPDVLLQAHSASLCMTFYTGKQFPEKYQGLAFAAEHGSWNRKNRTGYKIICVPIANGKPTGEYDDFLTGFVVSTSEVWGRPVGVTVDKQGALIVTEDGSGTAWRVRYTGKK